MWTSEDVHKSVVWDDSKTIPHWELSLNDCTLSCEMTNADLRETVAELLALAND